MNADVVYGLLTAILLVCYLIAVRVRNIRHDVECMHDFVHAFGDHPMISSFLMIDEKELEHSLKDMIREHQDPEVPPPFKEWDES